MTEFIYSYSLNLLKKNNKKTNKQTSKQKKQWNCRWEKMRKAAQENKLIVTLKDLYVNSVYVGNLCVQTKILKIAKLTYPLPPSAPVTVFVIAEKLLSLTQQTCVGLQDVLRISSRHALKTLSKRLQRNNFSSSKASWRRLGDTCWRDLQDVLEKRKMLTGDICI